MLINVKIFSAKSEAAGQITELETYGLGILSSICGIKAANRFQVMCPSRRACLIGITYDAGRGVVKPAGQEIYE